MTVITTPPAASACHVDFSAGLKIATGALRFDVQAPDLVRFVVPVRHKEFRSAVDLPGIP